MSRGSAESLRAGISLGTTGYEAESDAYLQARLKILYAVAGLGAAGLLVAQHAILLLTGAWEVTCLGALDHIVHVSACLVTGAGWWILRTRTLRATALACMDALGLYIALGAGLSIYAIIYTRAPVSMPAILSIFVILRAVVVPSGARRTLLLSLGAPIGLLAVQLGYGAYYVAEDLPADAETFARYVAWDQTVLLFAVGVATVASRVNFALRAQVREARKLGQYHLDEKIGEGGMGEVYRATHAMLRRPTAIKLLRPELTGGETLRRFEREVVQASRLSHPNTVSIFDYGRTPDGVFYYAMEFLRGLDLDHLVREHGPVPPARAIHVLRQACGALAEAHGRGLVHRDIKPGNIMLCERGGEHDVVKVVDFGLVRDLRATDGSLTQLGAICGTPETIAPEVLGGGPAGPAADLYALGVVGYFLLTGVPVFEAKTPGEFIGHHLHTAPVPLAKRSAGVPADLEAAILRCLAKEPAGRPADAGSLRRELDACADAGRWTPEDAANWWNAATRKAQSPKPKAQSAGRAEGTTG